MPDAVVIGAGPNGLVAANMLADRGWSVTVLEAAPEPGGAVRSAELIEPGFVNDMFSAFYPFAFVSPAITSLHLEDYGLRWCRAPLVLAHPASDGTCPVLSTDIDETAASLDACHPGDGDAWRRLYDRWLRLRDPLLARLFTPTPPIAASARLAVSAWSDGWTRVARFALLSVRRMGEEEFGSDAARRLLAGLRAARRSLARSGAGRLLRVGAVRTRPRRRVAGSRRWFGPAHRRARRAAPSARWRGRVRLAGRSHRGARSARGRGADARRGDSARRARCSPTSARPSLYPRSRRRRASLAEGGRRRPPLRVGQRDDQGRLEPRSPDSVDVGGRAPGRNAAPRRKRRRAHGVELGARARARSRRRRSSSWVSSR